MLDVLQKAYANESIQVEIKFDKIPGKKFILTYLDALDMHKQQQKDYRLKLAQYKAEGYDKLQHDEKRWQKHLDILSEDNKKVMVAPANLAEQEADEDTRSIMLELIGQFLRDEKGDLVCKDEKDFRAFRQMVMSIPEIANKTMNAILELFQKANETAIELKNSRGKN